jgi:hypothetical protein
VALHRRQLPIASPCLGFEGHAATATAPAFCTRCDKPVHDLSRLSEPEVIGVLAQHVGRELCIAYRTRADGAVVTRATPSRLGPAALAASLSGCAGHLAEAQTQAQDCVDVDGYHVACPPRPRLDQPVIPEAEAPDEPPADETMIEGGVVDGQPGGVVGGVTVGVVAMESIESQYQVAGADQNLPFAVGVFAPSIDVDREITRKVARELRRLARREKRRAAREARGR